MSTTRWTTLALWIFTISGCGPESAAIDEGGVYYFVAIHNEPHHGQVEGEQGIAADYQVLQQMVQRADGYGVRLTLMFTAQWADYISKSSSRLSEVRRWKQRGHEIAAHHHGIYHGNWDGYTDHGSEEAIAQRKKQGKQPEPYLGTLADYIKRLDQLDPDIVSGCLNDERDKTALPDEIRYDTCSGLANFGSPGQRLDDATDPAKGRNEFVTTGVVNGIERRWLAHYQICRDEQEAEAPPELDAMTVGVYGVVTHSIADQAEPLYRFLEHLHALDPGGARSRTVRGIIEEGLLPEQSVSAAALEASSPAALCGDGVCDAKEQADPGLCPGDCQ